MPNGIDLDRQTAKKEKPVGNILFTWLYDHSPGSRGKRSVLRAWRNHPRKWKGRSSGQSSSCMQRWIRGRRKLWGTVGLAPSCSIITCRRGSWTDMIPCWLSSDIGSEVRHLFPHTKLVLPHPLSKISTFILSTNLQEVAQTRIFLLHLQPINKNNTEKRHWTDPETPWGKDNSIERPCASGNGTGKPMLHLPAWDVASLSVAYPKVWRTLRSPNKSPEHQPVAKAAGKVWKIQTTIKDRKLT